MKQGWSEVHLASGLPGLEALESAVHDVVDSKVKRNLVVPVGVSFTVSKASEALLHTSKANMAVFIGCKLLKR